METHRLLISTSPVAPGHGKVRSEHGGEHCIAGTLLVIAKKSSPWMKLLCVTCD